MGNQDEEFYQNLSRKELQGLCKKHGLSANKSTSQLVKLLLSFFKGKDVSPKSSKEILSGPLEVCLSDLQPEEPLKSLEGARKVHKRRAEASEADSNGPSSSFKEKDGHDKRHKQKEINRTEYQSSDKVANAVCLDSANVESMEGFSFSTSNPRNAEIQLIAPTHAKQITSCSKLTSKCKNCNFNCRENDHQCSVDLRSSNLYLQSTSSEIHVPQVQCKNKTTGVCPAGSSLVSSSETSMELCPASFQFFVRSEEGINLYVDLNSVPSDWMKVLKDEVCIYQRVHHNKSRVLHDDLRGLVDSGGCMKTSFIGYLETGFQTKEDERNNCSRCIKPSLSSFERESCYNCGPSHQIVASKTPRPSAVTSSGIGVEVALQLEEDNRVGSSLCKADCGLQNEMDSSNLSCPEDSKAAPQISVHAPKMDGSSISVFTKSLNLNLSGPNCLDQSEYQSLKKANVCQKSDDFSENLNLGGPCSDRSEFQSLKNANVCQMSNEVSSEKTSLTLSSEVHKDSFLPDTICLENHWEVNQGSPRRVDMEMQLSVQDQHHDNDDITTTPHWVGSPPKLDVPNNAQSERDKFVEHQLDQEACGGVGNSAAGYLTCAFPDVQGRSRMANEEDHPGYPSS